MNRYLVTLALLAFSVPASAQWVAGGGYADLSDDGDGVNVALGAIYGSLGYVFEGEDGLSFMPEVRLGIGVSDDTIFGAKVEVESFFALSLRGQYDFDSGMYAFAAPSYARADLKASAGGFSVSEDSWEFGYGGGFGYKFSEALWGEISYESYDGTDVLSFGLKTRF